MNDLTQLPGFVLRKAAYLMMGELADQLKQVDLRLADASLLLLVGSRQDMTAAELGKLLDIKRANMVPLLNRLEEIGLVRRRPLDGKSIAILLTELGEVKRVEAERISATFEAQLLARIPEAHRDHFLPALASLTR